MKTLYVLTFLSAGAVATAAVITLGGVINARPTSSQVPSQAFAAAATAVLAAGCFGAAATATEIK